MSRRVVITGAGGISGLGHNWQQIASGLKAQKNCVVSNAHWDDVVGLHTRLSAPVQDFDIPSHYTRKILRSMGRVACMAVRASEYAIADAGLETSDLQSGRCGISYGSCMGASDAVVNLSNVLKERTTVGIDANTYLKVMTHTAAVNIGLFFGITGRIIPTASACTSGSQGIGYAYEAIKYGMQDMMLAGGSEELCLTQISVFDTLFATSTLNNSPELTPRPFDKDREGLVIGEGAGTLILEEYEHAKARGAKIYAELVGFACNSDGRHATEPNRETMAIAMQTALNEAGISGAEIAYVNAHGTATNKGDIAETNATALTIGTGTPISSLKSYLGHTLGACGALEFWATMNMMREGWFAPTLNLNTIDPECGELDYIRGDIRHIDGEYTMSNNFAFGGINTSLIIKRIN